MLLKTKLQRGGSVEIEYYVRWEGGGEVGTGQEIKIAAVATQEMVLVSLLKT